MKYKILPFIIGIMLTGCTGRYGHEAQVVGSNDSIPKSTKDISLIDSVITPEFKKIVSNDSVVLLGVKHFKADTYPGEEILYLDKRVSNSFREMKRYMSENGLIQDWNSKFSDSLIHVNNPFPDMNGIYVNVNKYHGCYVILSLMDETERVPILKDTCIYIGQMMPVNCPYISAERNEGNVTTYHYMEGNNPKCIFIKKLGGKYNMQLWKGFGQEEYELRVPAEKIVDMPELVYINNIGLESGSGFDIKFDPINYDSLMNSK